MKIKLFKFLVSGSCLTTLLTTTPLALASCGNGSTPSTDTHVTIAESEKSHEAGVDGSAIYSLTLSESITSANELNVSAETTDTSVSLSTKIDWLSDKTLKVKVTAQNKSSNSKSVVFSLKVSKTDGSWTQTISNLSLTGLEEEKTTYTISYASTPNGLTFTSQPKSSLANTQIKVEYELASSYYINGAGCNVKCGDQDITSKCSISAKSLIIPANYVIGNISITLATTQQVTTYTITYDFDSNVTKGTCPETAPNNVDFTATYTLKENCKLNLSKCSIVAGTANITPYVSFSSGTISIPTTAIIGNITIKLVSTTDTDTGTVNATEGTATILTSSEIQTAGIEVYGAQKVIYLQPTDKKLTVTISGVFTDTVIYMNTAKSTYNITFNNLTISNGASDNAEATTVFFAKAKNTSTINLTLTGSNTMLDKRTISDADYYSEDAVLKSQSALNISGTGSLKINDLSTNKGIYGKGIQTTKGSPLTISSSTIDVFAYDSAIQSDGLLTISGGTVNADSYYDDGLKTKFADPTDDLGADTYNKDKDINISGGTVNVYSGRNGINSAHDVITSSSANVKIYTTKTYAGDKVGNITLDELNMFVRIPVTNVTYTDLEKYFYTAEFNDGRVEYLTLKKIKTASQQPGNPEPKPGPTSGNYYYFKCDRPLVSTCSSFIIKKYSKENFGATTMTPTATSSTVTISNPTSTTNTNDTVTVSSISGSTISCSSSLDSNYKQDIGQTASIDTTVGSKGIKAKNEVKLNGGDVEINSYDTGISAGYGNIYCNSETAGDVTYSTGNITVSGANVTITSYTADGIKSYGVLTVSDGNVSVNKSVEALEAGKIVISGGTTKLKASDDGINASEVGLWNTYSSITSNKVTISVSGGVLDVQTNSSSDTDAIDSNADITITGGLIVARVPGSNPSSAVDSESKTLSMSNATLVVCGQIEPTLSGYTKSSTSGSWYKNQSYTITYNGSNKYTFTNDMQMNSSCKWYSNADVTIK